MGQEKRLRKYTTTVKAYLRETSHMKVSRERINYLTARIFNTEYARHVETLKKKGAFTTTIIKLYTQPIEYLASNTTYLESAPSAVGYALINDVKEALNLIEELRVNYNSAQRESEFLKKDIISTVKNLHETYNISYRNLVDMINDPHFSYVLLRNWLYGYKKKD